MKRLLLICGLLILLAPVISAKVTLPTTEDVELSNGLLVRVVERHDLPLFSFQMSFRAGSIYDPVGQDGLAALANEMLMRGTTNRTAKELADEVAFGGGTLGNFGGKLSAGFQGEFLTQQAENCFEILGDILTNAALTAEEFDKTKSRTVGGLQSRKEDPRSVAGDGISRAILGDSRFAHNSGGTAESVESLTRDQIAQFLKNHYTPDNAILVVCGDISPASVRNWIEKYLGTWKGSATLEQVSGAFPPVTGKEVIIYDKLDATQTQIRIGGIGITNVDPEYPAMQVARTLYGGSFTSRLMNEIRVNRGLSYSARFNSNSYKDGGLSYVSTFTRNNTVGEVIDIILAEAEKMATAPVPEEEHQGGINYRCGTYPLGFETNEDLAGTFANLWLTGLDKSFYEDFQEKLRTVSSQQGMEAAARYFPRDNYKLVLVGKADEIREQAEKYGPVTVISLSGE